MKTKDFKSRKYCYTIYDYERCLEEFMTLAESLDKHRYICFGLEICPDTGRPHIQGYIELQQAQRFTYIQKYFNFKKENGDLNKFHIEIANGTAADNKKYTGKEENFYEFGEPITQGARTDLREIKKAVEQDPRKLKEIIHKYGNNLQQVKYAQSLQPYYFDNRSPDNPPQVYWLFGKTGVGKTSLVFQTFEDVCSVSSYDWLGTGYLQNECLLFDDFRASNIPFETLLKITDRYPLTLFYKGGQIELNSPFIVVTAPKPITSSFSRTNEDLKQLLRRFIQINLDNIVDLSEVDLRNLDDKFIYKDDANYSHHDF